MQKFIKVIVNNTQAESVVTAEHYEKYKTGLTYIGPYVEEKVETKASMAELKAELDEKGIEYKGNASRATLTALLEE